MIYKGLILKVVERFKSCYGEFANNEVSHPERRGGWCDNHPYLHTNCCKDGHNTMLVKQHVILHYRRKIQIIKRKS